MLIMHTFLENYNDSIAVNHRIMTRARITYKKIPSHISTQLAGSVMSKMIKYFEVMLNILKKFSRARNCRILFGF